MKLYTVKEAAKLVGVSTNTLYKYLDENKIKAARGSAIQGRFRIPESALEEFLGVKISEPEKQIDPVGATFTVNRTTNEPSIPESHGQAQDLPLPKNHLPLRLARILLILALIAVLLDVFISRSVSLVGQISRLLFLFVMLLLAYQEGGYRRG